MRQCAHFCCMTKRATRRPETFEKPAHWSNEPPPVPKAGAAERGEGEELSPTRYGDWVRNGIAIDF